jgi:DNA-binding GntR family transcriptional regulator
MPRWLDAPSGADAAIEPEQRLYRALFDSVVAQRLTPGTKLPEVALGELFGVSRAVVRKVLQRLAHDHIVQLRPHRGAIVAVPTAQDIQQIFEARRALESAIVRLVTARATAADLATLRQQLRQEQDALRASTGEATEGANSSATPAATDQPAWVRLASAFHLRLADLAHNPLLQRYLVETVSRCSLIVALHEAPGHSACEHDEHQRIVDCIASGDADGAARLMDEHLHELQQHLALADPPVQPGLAQMLGLA